MPRPLLPLLLTAVLLTGCGSVPATSSSGSDSASPPAIPGLEVLSEDPSHEHVEEPVEYNRTPPLGGPHNPRWLACDVYSESVPHEFAVHSMEHGAVWLAHSPDLPEAQVGALEELARTNEEYVLVSPEPDLAAPVVAATWGAALEVESADDPRLEHFVRAYAGGGQGGEPGAPCRDGGVSPRQARGLLQSGS